MLDVVMELEHILEKMPETGADFSEPESRSFVKSSSTPSLYSSSNVQRNDLSSDLDLYETDITWDKYHPRGLIIPLIHLNLLVVSLSLLDSIFLQHKFFPIIPKSVELLNDPTFDSRLNFYDSGMDIAVVWRVTLQLQNQFCFVENVFWVMDFILTVATRCILCQLDVSELISRK
ncbi:hypothetical protein Tco_1028986 [Tanacetum coccineum]|uniref:Uncharacterized protein n=1 Tax=Tanacetum coccineum TaxID=301880 RepID=A0ABQ5G2G5_9ASTR